MISFAIGVSFALSLLTCLARAHGLIPDPGVPIPMVEPARDTTFGEP